MRGVKGLAVPVKRSSDRLVSAEFAESRSISRGVVDTMAETCCSEGSFKTREPGVVMKAIPMGMLWLMLAGWITGISRM